MSEDAVRTPGSSGADGRPDQDLLAALAHDSAEQARDFLDAVSAIAGGESPDAAIPMGLLAVSQVLVMGARLGAIEDIVPAERFEPDPGPDPELDGLRDGLAGLLDGLDEYVDLVDPVTSTQLARGSVVGDLTEIADALLHGLRHHDAGRTTEALWWWQFSYVADWGTRASAVLRVLQTMLAHLRLDADEDVVAEAEFDALHP